MSSSQIEVEMDDIMVLPSFESNNNNVKSQDPWIRGGGDQDDGNSLLRKNEDGDEKKDKYSVDQGTPTGGFAISVFNLMNAILGSGILGLSYAMSQLGAILFFVLLTFVAFLCLYAIHLLLILCEQTGVKAYEKLGQKALGNGGKYLAATCILLQNIGAMSSYLFIVKYELPNVLMTLFDVEPDADYWWLNGDYLVIIVTMGIIMPLACLKNIGFLGYTSGFSITCMLFFTGVIIAKKFMITCPLDVDEAELEYLNVTIASTVAPIVNEVTASVSSLTTDVMATTTHANATHANDTAALHSIHAHSTAYLYQEFGPQDCEAKTLELSDKWPYSIPTMTFSFVCHTAVLPIYAELKSPSPKRMQGVANTSIFICYTLYALAALFGYLTFFNWMHAEMLLMYSYVDSSDLLTLVVRITVLIAVVLTVPLTHFPARKALSFIIFPDEQFTWTRHLGCMGFLLTFINVLVIFVPSIKEVFGLIGATASTMLVFILPSLFFIIIDKRPKCHWKKISAFMMGGMGFCLMLESLTTIIIGYFN